MNPYWLIALVLGLLAYRVGLPPLVGFLASGFVLDWLGIGEHEALETIADIGVLLLLFNIGLKLDLRDLAAPHVWGVASLHMLATTAFFMLLLLGLGAAGVALVADLDLRATAVIAFALSFSSTVLKVV